MAFPVRVLHCVVGMNYGGYETLIMNIYRNIDTSKVQFDFLTSVEGVFDEEIKSLGGKIYRVPFITKVGPFLYRYYLDKFFKEHKEYTIVHSHMDKFSGMIMRSAKKADIPVRIAHSHNTQNEGGLAYQLVKNYYGKLINPNCTHRFACSQRAADWMFGKHSQECNIVYNGIEIEKYFPNSNTRKNIREKIGVADNFLVMHIGRFTEQKNHGFLLDIFSRIKAKQENSRLLLVGQGPLEEQIKAKAKNLGIYEDIIFYGTSSKVNELLQRADAFVFPSLHEGLGIAAVEAQAAGLYCTVSDNVPKEAKICNNISFISLDKPADYWAEEILSSKAVPVDKQALIDCEYNIIKTASFLENFYIQRS